MELSIFLSVMNRIKATLAANLSYKCCLRKDFCQKPYAPIPVLSSISFNNRLRQDFLSAQLPPLSNCPVILVAPYSVSEIQDSTSPLHSKATLLPSPVFCTRSLILSLPCSFVWILSLDLDSGFSLNSVF